MASPKSKRKPASGRRPHPESQHASTLRRRLSLGFDTFMSVVPLRKTTPQQELYLCATTAPLPTRPLLSQGISSPQITEPQILNPQIHLPSLAESQDPCPYDQTKYHSFRSIERSRCTFCGMRSSRPRSSEPCKACRSKSPFSHIKPAFRSKPMSASGGVRSPSPEYQPRYSYSSDECPRIVPPEIAAKRIGNPPRRAKLPVPRQGAINNILNPPPNHPASHSAKTSSGSFSESALESEQVRAASPKLHYLHGLPDSEAYPYVHKREVQQHFATIRAGASSPLTDFANAVQQKEQNHSIDFSETIYYGRIPKPALVSDVHKPFPEQARRTNVFVEHTMVVGGHVLTERSRSERQCSVSEQSYSSPVPARRSPLRPTQQPRVEKVFKDGENHGTAFKGETTYENTSSKVKTDSEAKTLLGLRGGGGNDNAYSPGCGFLFKQLLLTCRRSRRDMSDISSDDDDVPPRIPDPVQIARRKRKSQGTARLPKHIVRGCEPQATSYKKIVSVSNGDAEIISPPNVEVIPLPRRVTFAPTYKPPRPLICRLPSFTRFSTPRPPNPSHTQSLSFYASLNSQSATSITPCLRGGAGSPSTLRDDQNLPPTIFWLAGGDRRKTMRTESWKAQRPRVRRAGLLGWAVHGLQAGKAYGKADGVSGGGEEKYRDGVPKEGVEAGSGENVEVSGGRDGKKDEKSSPEGDSSAVGKTVERARGDAALDPVPEVAEGDGGAGSGQ